MISEQSFISINQFNSNYFDNFVCRSVDCQLVTVRVWYFFRDVRFVENCSINKTSRVFSSYTFEVKNIMWTSEFQYPYCCCPYEQPCLPTKILLFTCGKTLSHIPVHSDFSAMLTWDVLWYVVHAGKRIQNNKK